MHHLVRFTTMLTSLFCLWNEDRDHVQAQLTFLTKNLNMFGLVSKIIYSLSSFRHYLQLIFVSVINLSAKAFPISGFSRYIVSAIFWSAHPFQIPVTINDGPTTSLSLTIIFTLFPILIECVIACICSLRLSWQTTLPSCSGRMALTGSMTLRSCLWPSLSFLLSSPAYCCSSQRLSPQAFFLCYGVFHPVVSFLVPPNNFT